MSREGILGDGGGANKAPGSPLSHPRQKLLRAQSDRAPQAFPISPRHLLLPFCPRLRLPRPTLNPIPAAPPPRQRFESKMPVKDFGSFGKSAKGASSRSPRTLKRRVEQSAPVVFILAVCVAHPPNRSPRAARNSFFGGGSGYGRWLGGLWRGILWTVLAIVGEFDLIVEPGATHTILVPFLR